MKNTLETRLGMFIVLAMIAAFIVLQLIGGSDLLPGGYHLRAQFSNIQSLKVGDEVKMAGVPVGRVEKFKFVDQKVEMEMKLNKDAPVHTDSTASIKFAGLMGEEYVEISFGSPDSPRMEPNQLIATVEQPDLNALMAKLDNVASGVENLTKSFTGDKIDNLLGPFTDFMKQNNPRLTAIFANVQAISGQISAGKGTIGKLINDDAFYNSAYATITNLQDASTDIKATIAKAQSVVDQVNSGQGTIGRLVKDDTLYRETTNTMVNLRQIMQKVNNGNGTVGKLVNDQEFYQNAKLSLQKLDKATESLEDTGPLTVMGTIAGNLF